MRFQVGTDVGGTFTDLWVRVDDGRQAVLKSPSTADIIGGILNALDLASAHFELSTEEFCAAVDRFGHGTTAGLNALLTSSAARTALVTTAGFGDTLEIGRLKRQLAGLTELEIGDYTNRGRWPAIVPRQLVVEVAERIDRDGAIVVPLADHEIERLLQRLSSMDVQAVAVATLWSVANPEHEQRIGAATTRSTRGWPPRSATSVPTTCCCSCCRSSTTCRWPAQVFKDSCSAARQRC